MPASILELDSLDANQSTAAARPTRSVRVLHIINGEHYAGAERVPDLLALNLPEFGFEADFACMKPGKFEPMRHAKQSRVADCRMKSRFDLTPVRRLARLIAEEQYALVHAHTPRALFLSRLASAWAGVPLVYHVHSHTASDWINMRQNWLNSLVERMSLTRVSGVVTVSERLADYIRGQGVAPQRIRVVPNGVPTRGRLVERQPPDKTWTLGAVSLFRPRKGLEVLLESLALLRSQGLSVRLRAVGPFETPEYEQKVKAEVQRLQIADLVHWVGFTQDVQSELAQMDLFILPSLLREGLPMAILEAMAAGIPIIGTRVEGISEAVRDGQEGLMVAPNDPQDLACAIARFVRGEVDWSRLRAGAHRRQAECFSARSMAQGVAEVYQQVLGL
jgi:glycosyltransferase involved in cell wall biosynthesis